jgi:hypothetical protein
MKGILALPARSGKAPWDFMSQPNMTDHASNFSQ